MQSLPVKNQQVSLFTPLTRTVVKQRTQPKVLLAIENIIDILEEVLLGSL